MSDAPVDEPSRGEAGMRLNRLLEALVEAETPSQARHFVLDDTPAARFLQDESDTQMLSGDATIHYADAEIGVVSRPVTKRKVRRAYCVYGTDPCHEIGIVGIPLAPAMRPDVWTRTTILESLGIDGWHPIALEDGGHRDQLLPFNQARRIQGRGFVLRLRSEDFQDTRDEVFERPAPPIEEAFLQQGSSTKLFVGDLTIVAEEAGVLNTPNSIDRRTDPAQSTTVLIPPETPVAVWGPTTERRQFVANGGVYIFDSLGADQFVPGANDERPAHVRG